MLLNILSILAIVAYIAANIIMAYIAIKINGNTTVTEILSEQDFGLGKVGVSLVYWPTFVVLYIKSLLPINTKSCFNEEEFEEVQ